MSVIIATKADLFQEQFNSRAKRSRYLTTYGLPKDFSHVRRPFRGISIKDDTYATLEVYEADGTPVPLVNGGSRIAQEQIEALVRDKVYAAEAAQQLSAAVQDDEAIFGNTGNPNFLQTIAKINTGQSVATSSNNTALQQRQRAAAAQYKEDLKTRNARQGQVNTRLERFLSDQAYSIRYSNFLITGAQESRVEKYQIMETFGVPFIFFYGERPRIYQFSGVLLNSLDFQWRSEFWDNYDEVLRGTRLVERNARVVLSWDDITIEGYILQANAAEDSQQPYLVQFNFQFFVTNYMSTANLGDPRFPTPAAVSIDTTLWKQSDIAVRNLREPATTNVDRMRRANLQAAAQKNSPQLLGTLARGLAVASTFSTLATNGLETFVKNFETLAYGRDIRYPVGAFPVLSEIQTNAALSSRIDSNVTNATAINNSVATQLSAETRGLVEGFATDPAGRPEIFVQDKDLIVSLTNRYNKFAFRRIKILPPGGVFSKVTNQKNIGGLYRDNLDEYVQNTVASTIPYSPSAESTQDKGLTKLELDQIIGHMIKKYRAAGIPVTKSDVQKIQMQRYFSQSGVLRMGLVAGSFATAKSNNLSVTDSTFATDDEVSKAQSENTASVQKAEIRSNPKANLRPVPTGTPVPTKVITSSSIQPKPKTLTKPVITPGRGEAEVLSNDEVAELLKRARIQNARSL